MPLQAGHCRQRPFPPHVVNEKEITAKLYRPLVLKLHGAVQDDHTAYFLLEISVGREIFRVLRAEGQFRARCRSGFCAASVMLAFCQIHSSKIACGDLNPENPVLDARGHLEIVDFGLAKKLPGGQTWTICSTPDYLAAHEQGLLMAAENACRGLLCPGRRGGRRRAPGRQGRSGATGRRGGRLGSGT